MLKVYQLPNAYDAHILQSELELFADKDWLPHFNTRNFSGDWSVLPVRAKGGEILRSFHNPAEEKPFEYTSHLEKMPYTQKIIDGFKCDKTSIRFMKLGVESSIHEHKDYGLSLEEDEDIRIHIPVITHNAAELWLDGDRVHLEEGECWYLNFNLMHKLYNPGPELRIHLVMDLVINDWVRSQFPNSDQTLAREYH